MKKDRGQGKDKKGQEMIGNKQEKGQGKDKKRVGQEEDGNRIRQG